MKNPGPVACVEIRPKVTTLMLGHVKVAKASSGLNFKPHPPHTHSESEILNMMLIKAVIFRN